MWGLMHDSTLYMIYVYFTPEPQLHFMYFFKKDVCINIGYYTFPNRMLSWFPWQYTKRYVITCKPSGVLHLYFVYVIYKYTGITISIPANIYQTSCVCSNNMFNCVYIHITYINIIIKVCKMYYEYSYYNKKWDML